MKVLFVCVENAGRSQMAEAFAKRLGMAVSSAGTAPAAAIDPAVVRAMKEKGVDVSESAPKLLTMEMIDRADLVVTMGCSVEQVCPGPLAARMLKRFLDWRLDDPKGRPIEEVRRIRDEIERRVTMLCNG
ncbi:MAG: low molecular weight phosphatase family protein [Nitrososphaerota archaeon]|nr:low molecular weight phosphatase family protein [Nitrososphaerota archaeon]